MRMEKIPLEEKYELELTPISIGGKKLDLFTIANWDPFINDLALRGKGDLKAFPFWVRIWEASIVLTDHLVRIGLDKEKDILEMGAGTGVTGLFLGAFGYKVTITDYQEDALELLRMNAEKNKLHNVSVKKLDWNNPQVTAQYDIICGSELIYNETFIRPIIDLFRKYLRPEGTIFLAHDLGRKCVVQFVGLVSGRFEIENLIKTMKGKDELHKIVIHRLRRK